MTSKSSLPISLTRQEGVCVTDLIPITALGATKAATVTHGAVTISELPDMALASLTLRRGATAPHDLPGVGQAAGNAFWTGPDQWMIEGPGLAETDFAATLAAPGCSVTEQTDGFSVVEITAPVDTLHALMAKLVNLDPLTLSPGSATRTGLHHMTVFLIRRTDTVLAVIGMRSYARALWHALDEAAQRLAT